MAFEGGDGVLVSPLIIVNSAELSDQLGNFILYLVKLVNVDGLPVGDLDCSSDIFEDWKRLVVREVNKDGG